MGLAQLAVGLAQLAVGVTHARRGKAVGAVELMRRATDRLATYINDAPYGVDVPGLVAWSRALAMRIEQDGLAAVTPDDLTPNLGSGARPTPRPR